MTDHQEEIASVEAIVACCRPILSGHPPEVQGAAIADILSIFITAHAPHLREMAMEQLVRTATKLIPINELALFPSGKHPYTELYGDEVPEDGAQI